MVKRNRYALSYIEELFFNNQSSNLVIYTMEVSHYVTVLKRLFYPNIDKINRKESLRLNNPPQRLHLLTYYEVTFRM